MTMKPYPSEQEAAATFARECTDRPAVIRWCADRVRWVDESEAVQDAADYLHDLAATAQPDATPVTDLPAVIRWCAEQIHSMGGNADVERAAEYLDDLAVEAQEARDEEQAQANLDALMPPVEDSAAEDVRLAQIRAVRELIAGRADDDTVRVADLHEALDNPTGEFMVDMVKPGPKEVLAEVRRTIQQKIDGELTTFQTLGKIRDLCEGYDWTNGERTAVAAEELRYRQHRSARPCHLVREESRHEAHSYQLKPPGGSLEWFHCPGRSET